MRDLLRAIRVCTRLLLTHNSVVPDNMNRTGTKYLPYLTSRTSKSNLQLTTLNSAWEQVSLHLHRRRLTTDIGPSPPTGINHELPKYGRSSTPSHNPPPPSPTDSSSPLSTYHPNPRKLCKSPWPGPGLPDAPIPNCLGPKIRQLHTKRARAVRRQRGYAVDHTVHVPVAHDVVV